MGHLPITVDQDQFPIMSVSPGLSDDPSLHPGLLFPSKSIWASTGVVYNEDLVEMFLAAGELLSRSNNAEYLSRMSILSEIETLPPSRSSKSVAGETLDWIIQLTKSSSPVGFIEAKDALLDSTGLTGRPLDRELAKRILGTTPSTPLPLALKAYIRSLLDRQTSYLDLKIGTACASPPDLTGLNDGLSRLDTCSVQLLGMISAENMVLACNTDYQGTPLSPPLIIASAVPYEEGINALRLKAKWGSAGRIELGFSCPFGEKGNDEKIVWLENMQTGEGKWATATVAEKLAKEDTSVWTYENLEVNFVHRETRSLTLSIPQYPQANPESPKRRMVYKLDRSRKTPGAALKDLTVFQWQLLAESGDDWETMEWRINPICCDSVEPGADTAFSFFKEDRGFTPSILCLHILN